MTSPVFGIPYANPSLPAEVQGLAMTADAAVAQYAVAYMARRIDLPPGAYKLSLVADDAATVWLGTGRDSMRMVAQYDNRMGVAVFDLQIFPDESRLDVYLQDLGGGIAYTAFAITRENRVVYASNPEFWLFDSNGPIPDSVLLGGVDPRLDMPVLSMLPNWKGGITERLEWLTDVMTNEMGKEQRRTLRSMPRRSLELGYLRTKVERTRLANFFAGVGTKSFLLPLWFEQWRLDTTVQPTETGMNIPSMDMREFRVGTLAMLIDKDPTVFDIVDIAAVDLVNSRFAWSIRPTRTWRAGTRIVPLRVASRQETPSFTNVTDAVSVVQSRFQLVELDAGFEPSWGYCSPLFQLRPNWADSVVHSFDRSFYTLDNQVAQPFIVDPSDMTQLGQQMSFVLRGRQVVNDFRRFIAMARGRAVRFYIQSFTNDVLPSTASISGRYIDALPAGFAESMQTAQDGYRKIAIYFVDGSPTIYRDVELVEKLGTVERYYVDTDIPPIQTSAIKRISWLQTVRFDQDSFELQHDTDDSAVVRAALVTRTVDGTGMPPIDCWVTSKPYPIEFVDRLDLSAEIGEIRFDNGVFFRDEMVITAAVGTITQDGVVYRTQNVGHDDMEISALMGDGTMTGVGYRSITAPTDEMQVSALLQSASIRKDLIDTRMAPESITIAATVMNGTLE